MMDGVYKDRWLSGSSSNKWMSNRDCCLKSSLAIFVDFYSSPVLMPGSSVKTFWWPYFVAFRNFSTQLVLNIFD